MCVCAHASGGAGGGLPPAKVSIICGNRCCLLAYRARFCSLHGSMVQVNQERGLQQDQDAFLDKNTFLVKNTLLESVHA